LEAVGGSGITGTAALRPDGDDTEFATTLDAADQARRGDDYGVWLRAGTCAAPGRVVEDIEDLEVRLEDREDVVACGAIRRWSAKRDASGLKPGAKGSGA
jgi:hypothetical protein